MSARIPKLTPAREAAIRRSIADLPARMAEIEKDNEDRCCLRGKYAPETGVCVACKGKVVPHISFPWDGRLGGPPVQGHVAHWYCEGCGLMYQSPPPAKKARHR